MTTEFWMPAAMGSISRVRHGYIALTQHEQQALKQLTQGERPRKAARQSPMRRRRALRQRERTLDRLGAEDVRRLMQIVLALGL